MKGDFSRQTFDSKKHYTAVLMQQGRVQVDADWNEQQAINQYQITTETKDLIGKCGVPQTSDGFQITLNDDKSDLIISPGRIYVDGILTELETSSLISITFPPNTTNEVKVESLIVDHRELQPYQWVQLSANEIDWHSFRISEVKPEQQTIILNADLSSYNTATKLRRFITYTTQPDYPNPEFITETNPPQLKLENANYLIYLDVWQRHITAIDDRHIRETVLGDADTATRSQTVWQVKIAKKEGEITCDTPLDFPVSTGSLNVRTKPAKKPTDLCKITPNNGYQGSENQLYRVEIHDSGILGTATFKWSKDNGSIVTKIEKFDNKQLTVNSVGRDEVLGFADKQWVEIVSDRTELHNKIGEFTQIDRVNPTTRLITLTTTPTPIDPQWNPQLRRWDNSGLIKVEQPSENDGWIILENDIEIKFSPGNYQTGDYWLIPARATAVGDIEWSRDRANNSQPQPPYTIQHHYCCLALLNWQTKKVKDCRHLFSPMTQLISFFFLGGDGQETMPGEELPQPLQVGVANGLSPIKAATIRFKIKLGNGSLSTQKGVFTSNLSEVSVQTDDNGVATCYWKLDGDKPSQQVIAELVDEKDRRLHLPIYFTANLSYPYPTPSNELNHNALGLALGGVLGLYMFFSCLLWVWCSSIGERSTFLRNIFCCSVCTPNLRVCDVNLLTCFWRFFLGLFLGYLTGWLIATLYNSYIRNFQKQATF
ncbi:MAG TPA: DUF6519 domain-containing protein [Leptolyngbyaceae cyanobacterium]